MECSSLFYPLRRVKEEPSDDCYDGSQPSGVADFFRSPYDYPVKQEPQADMGPPPRSGRVTNGDSAAPKSKYKKRKPKAEPVDPCNGSEAPPSGGKKKYKQEKINEVFKERKKVDRFNGMPEEEVVKRTLPDHLVPNLDIVVIGINPGLFAAFKGHHYAGPGNHFWKCLFLAGLIPEPMTSEDDFRLMEYGIGFTNIVDRTTRGSADLTRKEIKEGSKVLLDKLKKYQPKIAVFNGKGIYEVYSGKKNFDFGKQPELIEGTSSIIYVMPSSSARCAQLPRAVDKVPFYVALKKLREHTCGRMPDLQDSEVTFPDVKLKIETDETVKQEAAERAIKEEMMDPAELAIYHRPNRGAHAKYSASSALLALSNSSSSTASPPSPPVSSPPVTAPATGTSGRQTKAKKKKAAGKVKAEPQHDFPPQGPSYEDRSPSDMMPYGNMPYPVPTIKREKMEGLPYGQMGPRCPYNGTGNSPSPSSTYNCPSTYYAPPTAPSYHHYQHCPPLLPPPGPTQLGSIVDQIPNIGAAAVAANTPEKDPHFHHHHMTQHAAATSPGLSGGGQGGGMLYFNQATAAYAAAPTSPVKEVLDSFHGHPGPQFMGQYPTPTPPTLQYCCGPGQDSDGAGPPGPAHSPSGFEQPVYTNLQSVRVKQERMDSGYGDF